MDVEEAEITEAGEAFMDDTWDDIDEDFFEGTLEDEPEDNSEKTSRSTNTLLEEEEDVLPEGVPPPSKEHLKVLQTFFGHSAFRPMQWKIIHAVLQRKDNCVVMATGYGKSLCYQFPAVYERGVTVVVSPLISLMEDQVLGLQALNIPACFLGSGQTNKSEVYQSMFEGVYQVVYVTPEFIDACLPVLESLMAKVGIMLFAIDEAHCVSQWGHDFRSSYRKLGTIRKTFPNVPILAVTATATQTVQKDICSVLKLRNPVVTITSFDRPNLYLEVKLKSKSVLEDLLPLMVRDEKGNYTPDGPTIIYCPTKKITEDVTFELRAAGLKCEMYHAGMNKRDRETAHHNFAFDKVNVIVATVAFGMGINKPDVRRVIHYGAPGSPESYYQEIGRAGRDGLASTCTVFYSLGDSRLQRYFISNMQSEHFREHQYAMLRKMTKFLSDTNCRRGAILSHFTSKIDKVSPTKYCCDNCSAKLLGISKKTSSQASDDEHDFTSEAKKIFETVKRCPNCGATSLIFILRGSKCQRVKPHWMKLPTYGAGKDRNEAFWKELIQMLVNSEWLTETLVSCGQSWGRGRGRGGKSSFMSYSAVGLSEAGYNALKDASIKVRLVPSAVMKDQLKYLVKRSDITPATNITTSGGDLSSRRTFNPRDFLFRPSQKVSETSTAESNSKPTSQLVSGIVTALDSTHQNEENSKDKSPENEGGDPEEEKLLMELYKSLVELRNSLADEINFMPYLVATNKTMLLLTQKRPTTLSSLHTIEGMSEGRIAKFGRYFVGHIRAFCKENKLSCPNTEVDDEDEGSKLDNQDWTFEKTSVGWQFKRNFASSAPITTSSKWISRTITKMDPINVKASASTDVLENTENTDIETKHNDENGMENLKISDESKSKAKYTVPKLSAGSSTNYDFDDLKFVDSSEKKDIDFSQEFEDIDFSEELEEPIDSCAENKSQELVSTKIPHSSSAFGKTLTPTLSSFSKSKTKKGIQFHDDPEEEKEKVIKSNTNYEEIQLNRKRELKASGWIDARKGKKKFKSFKI